MRRLLGSSYGDVDPAQLSPLIYLLESGSDRIGALDFQVSATDYVERGGDASLEELLQAAERVESGVPFSPELDSALMGRSSIGGARPKALLDAGSRMLIAKFSSATDLDKKRVATSFPNVTQSYLAEHNATAHLVSLSGSVEVMIQLGVADAIVDLVETGSTLAANRLRILEEIGSYETVLIQNQRCRDPEMADRVVRRLEGVVIARDYSLLEYNVPREKLASAEAIAPGFNSPTVNALEDKSWCSVRVMVKRGDVIDAMERLESLGATAILQTPISNCRL